MRAGSRQNVRPNEEIARIAEYKHEKLTVSRSDLSEEGLDVALNGREKGSRIYAKGRRRFQKPIWFALSCSEPPEGFARWS